MHQGIKTPIPNKPLLDHLRRVADLMDTDIKVLGFPVGVDAIIGLIPGIGDVIGGLISLYIVYRARAFRLPDATYNAMLWGILADVFIGSIPLIGDLFDLVYKVNERNLRRIERELGIIDVSEVDRTSSVL